MSRNRYILEINPDIAKSIVVFSMVGERGITAAFKIDDLEVLNSDYINEHFGDLQDDAYERGHGIGYQKGFEDGKAVNDKGCAGCAHEGESKIEVPCILCSNNFKNQWQAKTDNCIEVGDEVEWDGDKYIVTYRNMDINTGVIQDYDLMMWDGSVVDHVKKCSFVKTGNHYDISSILKEMQS